MADLLYDLLVPPPSPPGTPGNGTPAQRPDADALVYLSALAAKPLSSLQSDEPLALAQASQAQLLALQSLARKSYTPVLESARRHTALRRDLPDLAARTAELKAALPALDASAVRFANYRSTVTSSSNSTSRRRQALLLARNAERLVDVLELPPLLVSAASAAASASSSGAAPSSSSYGAALDLNGHIHRLHALYPQSPLVQSVAAAADEAMRDAAASLILSLKAPGLKLAASLRTISWLRRVLPDLEAATLPSSTSSTSLTSLSSSSSSPSTPAQERTLGAVFLVCRLATLTTMLDALSPLRDLADQERARQVSASTAAASNSSSSHAWSGGQQTERYLKRYIEIFREQSFAIVSMFRSIFPGVEGVEGMEGETTEAATSATSATSAEKHTSKHDPLEPLPPALAGFPLHLIDMLLSTLRRYLPTVRDQAARDSLLTQVLYCAGSLGRLGGDFGLFLATLDVGEAAEDEWAEVVRRHRQLAGRLESIVGDKKR